MGLKEWLGFGELVNTRAAVSARILTATDGRDLLVNSPDGWEVEQPWLWWSGPAGGDGTGGPWGNPPPGAENGPGAVRNLPAVTRSTGIICNTLAGLPWRVYRGDERLPTPAWIVDPMAARPDGRRAAGLDDLLPFTKLSGVELWSQWITSALWFGNGYVLVNRVDALGQPLPGSMMPLHPHDVSWEPDVGFVFNGQLSLTDYKAVMPDAFLLHLRADPPYDRYGFGIGVLDKHGLDLGLAAAVRQYAQGTFGQGIPSGYLKVNAPNPTQAQVDELKKKWLAQHGGIQRTIAVLNASTEFHPISISPLDAQLDSAREWALRDIALAFGIPAYMLGVPGDSSTYANVESRMTELRTFSLLPWARRIESTLDSLFPLGTSVKLALDATLRADPSTRYAAYSVAISSGWLTPDEVRALEDYPPLEPTDAPPVVPPTEEAP